MWDLVRFERWEHATHTTPQARRRLGHLLSCDDTIPLLGGAVPAQNALGKIRGSPSEGVRNVCLRTITPANCVTIMKAVGRSVVFLSHPGKGVLVVSTCRRMARSINRQMRSAKSNTRPKASMRSGFFRKRLFTMTGSLRKP